MKFDTPRHQCCAPVPDCSTNALGSVDAVRPLLIYVEDEILTQFQVEATLQDAGYDVLIASDGHEAIEKLAAVGPALRGLVTDVDLGECPNGWQVARQARVLVPTLPVVYVSGASAHDWGIMGVSNSVIVEKPFSSNQIITAMTQLMTAAGK